MTQSIYPRPRHSAIEPQRSRVCFRRASSMYPFVVCFDQIEKPSTRSVHVQVPYRVLIESLAWFPVGCWNRIGVNDDMGWQVDEGGGNVYIVGLSCRVSRSSPVA